MNDPSKVESILLAALGQPTAEARSVYLDDVCKGDPALREHVNRLLAAHPKAVEFLHQPAAPDGEKTAAYVPTGEKSGAIVAGRYKLLEKIGEGGMGEVWVADQHEPIRRRVALKLIKPGMDSRTVLARFEAERQALAVMDHPNIAKVLDAGTTPDGRPYFVMELVKGTPITEFCDARRLTPKQRLELFVPVCQAIQHAHTKGIIHRDIKPSNVLVALHDELPVPKVIDFGIAKAVGQKLTEMTIYTGFGALVGTPAYMAPEQATFNQLDIDTRADVYALGVLLYELLAGSPPVEPERMKNAALDEVLRLVRDEEPPRPSQRLSTSQAKASIAATRQSDPARLAQLIRGELDWIVMKALEKDRNRRYETANGFAADVQRYLAGEQVLAVPPSAAYRVKKFIRKNQLTLTIAVSFVVLLLVAVLVSASLAVKARRAELIAVEKNVEAVTQMAIKDRNWYFTWGVLENLNSARRDALRATAQLQVDACLSELRSEPAVGLLRLCETLKQLPSFDNANRKIVLPAQTISTAVGDIEAPETSFSLFDGDETDDRILREFVAAAILVMGQQFAQLLPPITHDGLPVHRYEVSPNRRTLLTRGEDSSARLWDLRTAKQVAILRQGTENVVQCGYSSDGMTIFTNDGTGVARFWDANDGKFRAQIEPRPNLYAKADNEAINKLIQETQLDYWHIRFIGLNECMAIGRDRLLTRHVAVKKRPDSDSTPVVDQAFSGPVELWDTTTGRRIAQLDVPNTALDGLRFLDDGRWIATVDGQSTVIMFSGVDGRLVSRLSARNDLLVSGIHLSPSGRRIVTLCNDSQRSRSTFAIQSWDTDTWKEASELMPVRSRIPGFAFLTDDLLAFSDPLDVDGNAWDVYRLNQPQSPVASFSVVHLAPPLDDLLRLNDGKVMNIRTGQRLVAPKNHRFHPSLAKFAQDGRFVVGLGSGGLVIDTQTEKQFDTHSETSPFRIPNLGQAWVDHPNRSLETLVRLFPSVDHLQIAADSLELWVQVIVRGELGLDGGFVKWDQSTWERKRQELAALPVPYSDFPFPGYVATDQLHWLRSEFINADDAKAIPLARELLRQAEAIGAIAEAAHWRSWLAKSVK
jgi:WD40 repeat protein/tRNA A-37 threonylcarbamoyl transferase component Bud32